jgi:hypothetical protein
MRQIPLVLCLAAFGCDIKGPTRAEIEADLQKSADEAIIVKAKDKDLCLVYLRGTLAVRGAEVSAVRCKSLEHALGKEKE